MSTRYTDVIGTGAQRLSARIGAYHTDLDIDKAVAAHESIIAEAFQGFKPRFAVEGGTTSENLAKQNIQARNRLVVSYELAQLSTQARSLPRAGASLLVLGSGNVDGTHNTLCRYPPSSIYIDSFLENLRGYYTKVITPLGQRCLVLTTVSMMPALRIYRHLDQFPRLMRQTFSAGLATPGTYHS